MECPPPHPLPLRQAPAGGANLSLSLTHGVTGVTTRLSSRWSFDPPVVSFVLPRGTPSTTSASSPGDVTTGRRRLAQDYTLPCNASVTSGTAGNAPGCQRVWFPATAAVIDIVGSNFGADAAFAEAGGGLAVVVGGEPCRPVPPATTIYVNDTLLRCTTGAALVGPVGVAVSVAGQPAALPPLLEVVALCGEGFLASAGKQSRAIIARPCTNAHSPQALTWAVVWSPQHWCSVLW